MEVDGVATDGDGGKHTRTREPMHTHTHTHIQATEHVYSMCAEWIGGGCREEVD